MTLLHSYEPSSLNQFVFENANVEKNLRMFASGELQDQILLFGDYGAGKSTLAYLVANAGLVAASSANVPCIIQPSDFSLKEIETTWSWAIAEGVRYPYVILEDVDQLKARQLGLRSFLDDHRHFPGSVIMTTNYRQLVDPGIANRSAKFDVRVPTPLQWAARAQAIVKQEGFDVGLLQMQQLLAASSGSIRDYGRAIDVLVKDLRKQP